MNGSIGLVTSNRYFFWVNITSVSSLNIFWQIDNNNSWLSCSCNIKSLSDCFCQILSFSHSYRIFADASCDANYIHFLKSIISNKVCWHLSCKAYQWNTVIICSGNTRNKIGSSRSACYKADTHLSCGAGVSVRCMD